MTATTTFGFMAKAQAKSLVIDDAGYLITNYFMRNHSQKGKGNDVFGLYNTLGDNFWQLIQYITSMPEDQIVYVMMHEDSDEMGNIKAKTIGKLLDEVREKNPKTKLNDIINDKKSDD